MSSPSIVPQKSLPPFTTWFSENRNELLKEFPNLKSIELTSKAMQRYKSLSAEKQTSQKRKQVDDGDAKQSGIAKLAKFGFNKVS